MGMGSDLAASDYAALIAKGIPPNVARYMATQPSYGEGESSRAGWPYSHRDDYGALAGQQGRRGAQDISYQPGGGQMPGMPWDSTASGQSQMSPQDIARMRLMMQIMSSGMQLNPNTQNLTNQLANPGQQGGGLMAMIMQNPQLLQWFMQQQGGPGNYPQAGGGVTLAQLLGAPQQTGQPT